MSLHLSILAIEGDHLAEFPRLWQRFDFEPRGDAREGVDWETVNRADDAPEDKAVCVVGGWTVVLDPEMVLMTETEACAALSAELKARVVGVVAEGVSASYGYHVFADGQQVRGFLRVDGELVDDHGAPLPEEAGIALQDVGESEVFDLLGRFGVDYDALEGETDFVLWPLTFTGEDADSAVGDMP
mgnify:CR=1 FL=1